MVGAFDEIDIVSFRCTDSPQIVAKIARDHDIFGISSDQIINDFQRPSAILRRAWQIHKPCKVIPHNK